MERPDLCTVEGFRLTSNIDEWIDYADYLENKISRLKELYGATDLDGLLSSVWLTEVFKKAKEILDEEG